METSNFSVRIPEPCHEDWGSMLPEEKGRFCNACCKTVVDFSGKSDAEIREILIRHKDEKVCGHFKKSQLERPLEFQLDLQRLPANMSATRRFALALLMVFGTMLFTCKSQNDDLIGKLKITTREERTKGEVAWDSAGVPRERELPSEKVLIDAISCGGTSTELLGEVEPVFDPVESTETGLMEFVQGDTVVVPAGEPDSTEAPQAVNEKEVDYESMEFTMGFIISDIETKTDQEEEGVEDPPAPDAVLQGPPEFELVLDVFPNPSMGDFTIGYELRKRSNVRVDIFDEAGRWVQTLVNQEAQYEGRYRIPVSLPDLKPGYYILSFFNEGKKITKKLVLER